MDIRCEARAQDDDVAVLMLYGDIDEYFGISADMVRDALNQVRGVPELHIHINSRGGVVFEGVAIFSLLHQFAAKKTTFVDALAASVASVIALAGDEVVMPSNAMMMIHDPWAGAIGNAREMREMAERLDKINDSMIIPTYLSRTTIKDAELRELMEAETFLSADECQELGFCQRITDINREATNYAADMDLSIFDNAPKNLCQGKPTPYKRLAVNRRIQLARERC